MWLDGDEDLEGDRDLVVGRGDVRDASLMRRHARSIEPRSIER
jgi:hypothetical protein